MGELMRQAARMQRKMDKVRDTMKDKEVSATAAGDKVTVIVSCDGKLRRIDIDPDFLQEEGLELALDSVVAAANKALDSADELVEGEISKVTGGLKIPGITS